MLALAVTVASLLATSSGYAQDRPRTLFDFLFRGKRERAEPSVKKPAVKQPTARSTARRASAEPPPVLVEKAADARVVLVVGDFLGSGIAEGLATVFEADPSVRVVDRSNGSSGFVRDDHYDWPAEIDALLDAEKPAAAIVMIGSNDRQQMRVGDVREAPLTEKWNAEYTARAEALAAALERRKVPFVWVGLPAFKSAKMSSDMIAFNDMLKLAAEGSGGTFVDIWEGFVDENGAYVTNGPDINGQPVRLRANDGINFTQAGKRKIAFYAEKPLNRLLNRNPSAGPLALGVPEPFGPSALGEPPVIDRTLPVSLSDPDLDGGDELLGLVGAPKRDGALTPSEKLAIQGIAPDPAPGRVDDFGTAKAPDAAAASERTSAIKE